MIISSKGKSLLEYRCNFCNRLLFKGLLLASSLEIKCKKCSQICSYNFLMNEQLQLSPFCVLVGPDNVVINASNAIASSHDVRWQNVLGSNLQPLLTRWGFDSAMPVVKSRLTERQPDETFTMQPSTALDATPSLRWRFIKYFDNEYLLLDFLFDAETAVATTENLEPETASSSLLPMMADPLT